MEELDRGTEGPGPRTFLGLAVAAVALVPVDVLIATRTTTLTRAVVPMALASIAALALAHRRPAWAAVGLAAASTAMSLTARALRSVRVQGALPEGWWARWWGWVDTSLPLLTEVFGLGALCLLAIWAETTRRAVIGCGAVLVALVAMGWMRWDTSWSEVLLLGLLVVFAASIAAGIWLRSADARRVAAEDLARQDERLALARDLHDLVAHHMTGIALHAQAAQMVLDEQPDVARRSLVEIEQSVRAALASVRSVVTTLREPAAYVPTATIDDIVALATKPDAPGLVVRVDLDPAFTALDDAVVATAHRIALEAVSNARRHAIGATLARVHVHVDGGDAVVAVVNDGAPPPPARRQGYGLIGIDERVRALGGTLRFGPVPEGGWALVGRLPAVPAAGHVRGDGA